MSSSEIQSFAEGLGLDWILLLPTLKKSNLLKIEKIQSSRQFWYWIPNHNGHDKEEKPLKVVLPDKSITVNKAEIKQKTRKRTDT